MKIDETMDKDQSSHKLYQDMIVYNISTIKLKLNQSQKQNTLLNILPTFSFSLVANQILPS